MNHEQIFAECAAQLESVATVPEGAQHGLLSDAAPNVQALVAALKSKDYLAVAKAAYKLVGLFLGGDKGSGELQFQVQHAPGDGKLLKVIGSVLLKLLPIFLGEQT